MAPGHPSTLGAAVTDWRQLPYARWLRGQTDADHRPLVLGMQAVRAESPNQALSYGRAIGTGALISAFSGAMSGALVYVYGKFINPEFHQVMYEVQVAEMSARMTASQIEQAEPMMRFLTSAGWIASTQLLFSPVFGVILSAMVGLFLKRAPRESPPAVPTA